MNLSAVFLIEILDFYLVAIIFRIKSTEYDSLGCFSDYILVLLLYFIRGENAIDELLSSYGQVIPARIVVPEIQEIDVYFQPHSSQLPEALGLWFYRTYYAKLLV
ncbi:MAG: hypothetical protein F6K10_42460 [Moorea sp. SIO2B7]|nr:hypothetical protein [Moorena sp. SIO2B7]